MNEQRIPEDLGGKPRDDCSTVVPDRECNMPCAQGPNPCFVEMSEPRAEFGCYGHRILIFGGDGVHVFASLAVVPTRAAHPRRRFTVASTSPRSSLGRSRSDAPVPVGHPCPN